jgi:hypothetical protein
VFTEQLVSTLLVGIATGVGALVGVVWRLGTQVARQNGNVAMLLSDLREHKTQDREDFLRLHQRLDDLSTPARGV